MSRASSGRQSEQSKQSNETEKPAFIGVRLPKELHTRLYRAKASLELKTGKFYGMGRLMERVIRSGLEKLEKLETEQDSSN